MAGGEYKTAAAKRAGDFGPKTTAKKPKVAKPKVACVHCSRLFAHSYVKTHQEKVCSENPLRTPATNSADEQGLTVLTGQSG